MAGDATADKSVDDDPEPDSTPDPVISDAVTLQHIMALRPYFTHDGHRYLYADMSTVADKILHCTVTIIIDNLLK